MIHGRDSNIKQWMVVCALVLLFPAQTNVDLVHIVNSPSELFSVQPIIIHLIFMFVLPITCNTGENQDTPDWRGRLLLYWNDLRLEGRKSESSGGGRGLEPTAVPRSECLWFWRTSWRVSPCGGTEDWVLLPGSGEDFRTLCFKVQRWTCLSEEDSAFLLAQPHYQRSKNSSGDNSMFDDFFCLFVLIKKFKNLKKKQILTCKIKTFK